MTWTLIENRMHIKMTQLGAFGLFHYARNVRKIQIFTMTIWVCTLSRCWWDDRHFLSMNELLLHQSTLCIQAHIREFINSLTSMVLCSNKCDKKSYKSCLVNSEHYIITMFTCRKCLYLFGKYMSFSNNHRNINGSLIWLMDYSHLVSASEQLKIPPVCCFVCNSCGEMLSS